LAQAREEQQMASNMYDIFIEKYYKARDENTRENFFRWASNEDVLRSAYNMYIIYIKMYDKKTDANTKEKYLEWSNKEKAVIDKIKKKY